MTLTTDKRLGPYEILSPSGAGGSSARVSRFRSKEIVEASVGHYQAL